jgi:hypothetical protein
MKQIMKVAYIAIIASALLVTGIAPIGITYADQPTAGTGTMSPEWDPRDPNEQRGESCSYTRHDTGTIEFTQETGAGIVGTGIVDVYYSANTCSDVNRFTMKGIYTFDEVTIAGRTGGAVIRNEAQGTLIVPPIPPLVNINGNLRLASATGDLEGLHLTGKFWLTPEVFPTGQYEIRTHFDP